MNRKKIIRILVTLFIIGVLVGGSVFAYIWFMPHRDVQASPVDYTLTSKELINEYLTDRDSANDKYLQEEGDSKILAVSGTVSNITSDMDGKKVVYLKDEGSDLGFLCYFIPQPSDKIQQIKIGDHITIKGAISSGPEYDEDLDLYEDGVMKECDILNIN